MFLALQPQADTRLSVAVQTLPVALGNVHRSTSSSELYTWSAIFDPLTMVGPDAVVRPWLMQSWQPVNPTTWHFQLQRGIQFHNGEPFNAAAVINTLSYLISDEGRRESLSRIASSIASVRALGPLTVEIKTHFPNLMLPAELGIIRVVAPKHWNVLGAEAFALEPIGSGPYKVDRWGPAKINLSAFRKGLKKPGFDRLEINQLSDPTARSQGILAGAIDIGLVISPDAIDILATAGHSHHVSQGAGAMGIAFIMNKGGPIANPKVRRALNFAVNRQAYIAALLQNGTRPATQATPANAIGWDPLLPAWNYDPGRATKLIKEAGYGDGFKLIVELAAGGAAADAAIYQAIGQDLRRVGIDFEVKSITIQDMISKFNFGGWTGEGFNMDFNTKPSLDALRPFIACFHRALWHCRSDLEPITRAAQSEWDPEKRVRLVRQLIKAYHDDPPMLYLHDTVMFDGLSSRVQGYKPVNLIVNYHDLTLRGDS
ncbi:MAG: ABC transporter substrate-binding protein [Rhodospirillaceae bacterium]